VFGGWWHVIVKTTDRAKARADAEARRTEVAAAKGKWPDLFERIGMAGIEFVSRTDHAAGYTVTLALPSTGKITYAMVESNLDRLLVPAKMRPTQLKLEPGAHAAEFRLHVFTEDVLAQKIPYEVDRRPKSIHEPMPIGRYIDGRICVVTFREIAALMVGLRGSGKSALLNTHLAHLTGCVDAVVWMIDAKGGRTARPWIKPFLDATTGRPALDWVAFTPDEMDAMLLAAREAITHRSTGEGEKVHPTSDMPAIVLIVEEASQVTGQTTRGNMQRAELAEQITVLGRSEAVDPWLITQRAVLDMLGTGSMKSQLELVYGLGVTDAADAARIFSDGKVARELFEVTKAGKHPGTFLVQQPRDNRVMAAKGAYLDPSLIPGVAATNSEHRADLDPGTARHVHDCLIEAGVPGGYFDRWDRYKARLNGDDWFKRDTAGETPRGVSQVPSQPVSQSGVSRKMTTAERLGLVPPASETRDVSPASHETAERDVDAVFAEITAGWDTETPPADIPTEERDDTLVVPPILKTLVQIFGALGAEKLHTRRILEELPGGQEEATRMTAKAFGLLMAKCGVAAAGEFVVDGERGRGYVLADVLRAVARARDGAQLDPGAFDWPDPQDR
jgi:S-DNA-T family DNA segregation ATPase FtsK/SpoIIIE